MACLLLRFCIALDIVAALSLALLLFERERSNATSDDLETRAEM